MRKEIVLDLDGVLANFASAAAKVHGRKGYPITKWDFFKDWGISTEAFWQVIHSYGTDFYEHEVNPYPWTAMLWRYLRYNFDVVLMTAPSQSPHCYAGKKLWVDKYLDGRVELIVGSAKHWLAQPGRVLIDDSIPNIAKFVEHGGEGILFPQPWNGQESILTPCEKMAYLKGALNADGRNTFRMPSDIGRTAVSVDC